MTDFVTGTPSVVGFTNDHGHHDHGWTAKDTVFAHSVDNGEQTRDILRDSSSQTLFLRDAIGQSIVATATIGGAINVAVEKIGAAGILEAVKNAAALNLAVEKTAAATLITVEKAAAAAQLTAAQNHAALSAQMAECCCELKELNREIESNRVRDQLQLLQTQFMILTGGVVTPAATAPRGH